MKFFLFFYLIVFSAWAQKSVITDTPLDSLLKAEKFKLSRSDLIIAEHVVNMMKLINKGYINQEILNRLLVEVEKSNHFRPFNPWLVSIRDISKFKLSSELIVNCRAYLTPKEKLPLERRLERMSGNYCRERALEAIGRDIEKNNNISEEATAFIQENLKFFLTKKNKKNFAYFIQSHSGRPEILKKISDVVTTYSVSHQIVPSQEVLQDIEINEQITRLIQSKGFNPLQHQNVFYAEYGKLIELGYKSLDNRLNAKPVESKINEHYTFLKNYLELNQDHLPVGLCLSRLNDFSKAVYRAGFVDISRDIFKYIIRKNNKEIIDDAIFFYLWTYLVKDDFQEVLKLASKYKLTGKNSESHDPRMKYWLAHAMEQTKQKDDAIEIYEQIIQDYPLNFYAIMSSKKLQAIKPNSAVINYYASNVSRNSSSLSFEMKDIDDDHISSLVRLRAWAKLDNQKMVALEVKRLNNHNTPSVLVKFPSDKQLNVKSDLHLLNAKLIQEIDHLATFRYLYEVLEKKEVIFNRSLLEILYPRPFMDELGRALKNDSLDPIVVLSLIRQESVFNPMARSPVGARGLMQLMPTTAKRMRRGVSEKSLANPKINIELGTKYFKGLVKRYDGNLVYVLSAYNAGETRVEKWKNLYWDSDESILKNIEQIPFLETRNYCKFIFRNIFFYKLLQENKQLADSGEPNKIFDVNLGFKR